MNRFSRGGFRELFELGNSERRKFQNYVPHSVMLDPSDGQRKLAPKDLTLREELNYYLIIEGGR